MDAPMGPAPRIATIDTGRYSNGMRRSIVTGGSRGIGLAIARGLLDEGGQVVITGRDRARVSEAVATLAASGAGDRIAGEAVDVRHRKAVDKLVAETSRRFGGLDVVINNAGVAVFSNLETMSDEDWAAMIETNVTGPFYVTRAAIPALRRSGGGWIINIASLAGRNYFPGGGAYCGSKAALIAMSESVMQEVRDDNIRVSVVMPGSVATEFTGPRVDDDWKLDADDVAEVVMDLLRHPSRSLPSRVEIRPSRPRKG
jgi:NAD(P)-dependent dehydrogenase (short-subunit alcohol dehydrogenase family)